jgi:hypothetical protein
MQPISPSLQNLIFALITGHCWGPCVPSIKPKDIWDFEPGIRFFGDYFIQAEEAEFSIVESDPRVCPKFGQS